MDNKVSDIIRIQKQEITQYHIYKKLSNSKYLQEKEKDIFIRMTEYEKKHVLLLEECTNKKLKPNLIIVYSVVLMTKILGLAFCIKLLERKGKKIKNLYKSIKKQQEFVAFIEEEHTFETNLVNTIKSNRLSYISSVVLGLNDALVEILGILAGLTLAIGNTKIIAAIGVITGIAASLSMASSEYLSTKSDDDGSKSQKIAILSSIYTGVAYIVTVMLMVFPYFIFFNALVALLSTVIIAIFIILGLTFYISVVQDKSFLRRFIEMSLISLGVAIISFSIGLIVRQWFNLDII